MKPDTMSAEEFGRLMQLAHGELPESEMTSQEMMLTHPQGYFSFHG